MNNIKINPFISIKLHITQFFALTIISLFVICIFMPKFLIDIYSNSAVNDLAYCLQLSRFNIVTTLYHFLTSNTHTHTSKSCLSVKFIYKWKRNRYEIWSVSENTVNEKTNTRLLHISRESYYSECTFRKENIGTFQQDQYNSLFVIHCFNQLISLNWSSYLHSPVCM